MEPPPEPSQPNAPGWPGRTWRRARREQFLSQHRPPWWPENEDWPPRGRRRWRRMERRHNPFFRRLGCLFALFNMISIFFVLAGVGLILNALGIIHVSAGQFQQFLPPLGGIALAFVIAMVVLSAVNLRRMSMPLDDLLDASNRIAEGDYSARVPERGPHEVRSLARAFNAMAGRLQASDQQRRSMLADVSHELRTPLTIIRGNLEGVLDGVYPADETRLKSVLEETQLLSRLVDDLRTLALAESGTLELKSEPVDITVLIGETASVFQSQASASEVKIELALACDSLTLEVDPERIRQVLTNLIANALRYSPRGSSLRVSLQEAVVDARSRAVIAVEDSGPGIAPEDLPHVFDRYYKSSDSRGMGLGLAIAKFIVEAHGGQIGAESTGGKGTRIWLSLPVQSLVK